MRMVRNGRPDVDQLGKVARRIAIEHFGAAHLTDVKLDRPNDAFTHLFNGTPDDADPR